MNIIETLTAILEQVADFTQILRIIRLFFENLVTFF